MGKKGEKIFLSFSILVYTKSFVRYPRLPKSNLSGVSCQISKVWPKILSRYTMKNRKSAENWNWSRHFSKFLPFLDVYIYPLPKNSNHWPQHESVHFSTICPSVVFKRTQDFKVRPNRTFAELFDWSSAEPEPNFWPNFFTKVRPNLRFVWTLVLGSFSGSFWVK